MSKTHIQSNIQINVDKNIKYIIEFLMKIHPYSLIPYASCEGDINIYKKNKFAGSAYIVLIVRKLSDLDDFVKKLNYQNSYNFKIEYHPCTDKIYSIVSHFRISWNPNYNTIINNELKQMIKSLQL